MGSGVGALVAWNVVTAGCGFVDLVGTPGLAHRGQAGQHGLLPFTASSTRRCVKYGRMVGCVRACVFV